MSSCCSSCSRSGTVNCERSSPSICLCVVCSLSSCCLNLRTSCPIKSELLLLLVPVCAPSGHLLYRSRISCILLKRYHHQQTSQKSQSQLRELLDPEKKKKIRFRETKKIQRRRRRRRCRETDLLARTWKSLTLIATDQLEAVEKKIRKITNPGPHTYRYKDLSLNATEEPHEEVCSFWHRNKT